MGAKPLTDVARVVKLSSDITSDFHSKLLSIAPLKISKYFLKILFEILNGFVIRHHHIKFYQYKCPLVSFSVASFFNAFATLATKIIFVNLLNSYIAINILLFNIFLPTSSFISRFCLSQLTNLSYTVFLPTPLSTRLLSLLKLTATVFNLLVFNPSTSTFNPNQGGG